MCAPAPGAAVTHQRPQESVAEGLKVSVVAPVAPHSAMYSPCTSRCSCTIRDLYSPHFSYRVCCKRYHPPHCQASQKQAGGGYRLRDQGVHRGNLQVKRRFRQINGPPKKEWGLHGQGLGKGAVEVGQYLGCFTFRYCRRASSSAFRIDVPYRVSSLGRLGNQRLSEPPGCRNPKTS